jgi:multidrug efflux pump
MQPVQDLTIEDRVSRTQYQFVVQAHARTICSANGCRAGRAPAQSAKLAAVATDLQDRRPAGLRRHRPRRRQRARRQVADIDAALYNAFGQRLISTIFTQSTSTAWCWKCSRSSSRAGAIAQLHVCRDRPCRCRWAPGAHRRTPGAGCQSRRPVSGGHGVVQPAPGVSLGEAVEAIDATRRSLRMPASMTVRYEGAALAFRASLSSTLLLILAAVVTMYIVLGVLYESFIHPLTILSTLPSAAGRRAAGAAGTGTSST